MKFKILLIENIEWETISISVSIYTHYTQEIATQHFSLKFFRRFLIFTELEIKPNLGIVLSIFSPSSSQDGKVHLYRGTKLEKGYRFVTSYWCDITFLRCLDFSLYIPVHFTYWADFQPARPSCTVQRQTHDVIEVW